MRLVYLYLSLLLQYVARRLLLSIQAYVIPLVRVTRLAGVLAARCVRYS